MTDVGAGLGGTWQLVSAEDFDAQTDQWVPYSFGDPPCGHFMYDRSGRASIQIMTTPPVVLARPDSPTPDEALEIFNGYTAYFGTYDVRRANIYHQVEGAWTRRRSDPCRRGHTPWTRTR